MRHREKGSAIIYILIAVALLAALSFAISRGSRTSSSNLSQDQARIAASEIIDYGNVVANAVQTLRLRGCSDTEINFENPIEAGYTNGSAPADDSCDIFSPSGGSISWSNPNSEIAQGNTWFYQGEYEVTNIGTAGNMELLMSLSDISVTVCTLINERLGITNPSGPPTNDSFTTSTKFTGTYDDGGGNVIGNNGEEANFAARAAACFDGPPAGTYHFYQVVTAR